MIIRLSQPGARAFVCRLTLLLLFAGLLTLSRASTVLTNASDVLALSANDALSGIPVSVIGVVTAAQTNRAWNGRFFVQDSSSGVFVDNINSNQPAVGDLVEVKGVSHPGGYAPIISKPHWTRLGKAPLPEAKAAPIESVMSGVEDSQRVEILGVVRSAGSSEAFLETEIASGGYRVHAYAPGLPNTNPAELVGAKVLVRGTVATRYTTERPRARVG